MMPKFSVRALSNGRLIKASANDSVWLKMPNRSEGDTSMGFQPMTRLEVFSKLSKRNLSVLVTSTAVWAYYMAPLPHSHLQALGLTCGTFLTACSANSLNQLFEMPYDSQMERTRNRVLVDGRHISPFAAWNFGVTTAALGTSILYATTSPTTSILGLSNVFLYAFVYTRLKRTSTTNTSIGALVGAVPPMMGWMAHSTMLQMPPQIAFGGITLSLLLYFWQFPHFNSLSWQLRSEYCRAGYSMSCIASPRNCKVLTLLHSAALLPLCGLALPAFDITTWYFVADSIVFNLLMLHMSLTFLRKSNAQSAKSLFVASLYYLPTIMMISIINAHVLK